MIIQDISSLIPQKKPMILVDTLQSYTEESLVALLHVTHDTFFVAESFLSESGVIEHMAQSVALHTGYSYFLKQLPAPVGYIGSITKMNLVTYPKVNDIIKTEVSIIQEFMGITLVDIASYICGECIATAQMKTVIV